MKSFEPMELGRASQETRGNNAVNCFDDPIVFKKNPTHKNYDPNKPLETFASTI